MFEEFTGLTPEEAKTYNRTESSLNWTMRSQIADLLQDGFILEVGCGNGIDSQKYYPEFYVGMDISPALIEAAKVYNPKHKFIVGNAAMMPFLDGTFDWAFCIGVFENLPSLEICRQVLREMLRVSKQGIVIGWYKAPHLLEPTEIKKVIGHFNKECSFPHLNENDFISGIFDIKQCNKWIWSPKGYEIWRIKKDLTT